MVSSRPHIPSYALYGEHDAVPLGDFAHIETIAARSGLHDWEIQPHRHTAFVQLLLVQDGQALVSREGRDAHFTGPFAVVVPLGMVHGFCFSQDTCGHVLTVSADFGLRAPVPGDPLTRALGDGLAGPLDSAAARRADWLAQEMLTLQQGWIAPDPLVLSLAEALVRSVALGCASADAGQATTPDQRLARLRGLIDRHYREQRPLAFYATALGLTPRTLVRLTATRLNCSPTELIHRRLATEARRLLRYTNASASQIAAELGFADPSYFSRFYLRMTGRRPGEERAG